MAVIKNDKLKLFLSAAMALPGMAAHAADSGVRADSIKIDYNHGDYSESDHRMSVKADQLGITIPVASQYEIGLNAISEVTSGASPVFYLANPDEAPVMVLQAGASIKDKRDVGEISGSFYGKDNLVSANIGTSQEDDYKAQFFGINYLHYFNAKNTNLIAGISQSNDDVWNVYFPPGSANFDPFLDAKNIKSKKQQELVIGVDQLLNENSRIQFTVTSVSSRGFLSDPYKRVYIQSEDTLLSGVITTPDLYQNAGGTPESLEESIRNLPFPLTPDLRNQMGVFNDSRPDKHQQYIFLTRFSRYIETTDSALHLDWRFNNDDWGAQSSTLEAQWSQNLPGGVIITPGIRYYAQDSADFYNIVFASKPSDNIYSSDYRLAGFGAISYKLAIDKTFFNQLSFRFSYENYNRSYDLAWNTSSRGSKVDDYTYQLLSLSVGYSF